MGTLLAIIREAGASSDAPSEPSFAKCPRSRIVNFSSAGYAMPLGSDSPIPTAIESSGTTRRAAEPIRLGCLLDCWSEGIRACVTPRCETRRHGCTKSRTASQAERPATRQPADRPRAARHAERELARRLGIGGRILRPAPAPGPGGRGGADLLGSSCTLRRPRGCSSARWRGLPRADFGEDGRILVAVELERAICDHVAVQLKSGWRSVDLWEATRRQGGAADCALLAGLLPTAISRAGDVFRADHLATKTQRRLDPAGSGWARDVSLAIRLIENLAHLPVLDDLRAIGVSLHRGADPKRAAGLSKSEPSSPRPNRRTSMMRLTLIQPRPPS